MINLHCVHWGLWGSVSEGALLYACILLIHDACVEGLVCAVFTEVSRVRSGHLTL